MKLPDNGFKFGWTCDICGLVFTDCYKLADMIELIEKHIMDEHKMSQIATALFNASGSVRVRMIYDLAEEPTVEG